MSVNTVRSLMLPGKEEATLWQKKTKAEDHLLSPLYVPTDSSEDPTNQPWPTNAKAAEQTLAASPESVVWKQQTPM